MSINGVADKYHTKVGDLEHPSFGVDEAVFCNEWRGNISRLTMASCCSVTRLHISMRYAFRVDVGQSAKELVDKELWNEPEINY